MIKTFGVFEGGGVKIIALAGAFKAAEEKGISFEGIAGSSAGAIIASLISVGYTSDEIKQIVLGDEIDYAKFQDGYDKNLQDIIKLFVNNNWKKVCIPFTKQRKIAKQLVDRLQKNKGVYVGNEIHNTLTKLLNAKGANFYDELNDITFGSLKLRGNIILKIVASDISSCQPLVYNYSDYPQIKVVDAVRDSISIPLFFQPQNTERILVDGGLVSNFPAWVFDVERVGKPFIPTIGFRLRNNRNEKNKNISLKKYLSLLGETALAGSDFLQHRAIKKYLPVNIKVNNDINSFDFLINKDVKLQLFEDGYTSAKEVLEKYQSEGLLKPNITTDLIKEKIELLLKAAGNELFGNLRHLRVSIMLPTSNNTRKVVYCYNFDKIDKDNDLELAEYAGCSGNAWRYRTPIVANMKEAEKSFEKWGISKKDQKKVRKSLKWMLSVPIFQPVDILTEYVKINLPLMGNLNFDSDSDTAGKLFIDKSNQISAEEWAKIFSRILYRGV